MKKKKRSILLVNKIKILLKNNQILKPNDKILVAFSGGQDSIVLLIILFLIQNEWNTSINLVYCNHLWKENSIYSYLHITKIAFCLKLNLFYSITVKSLNSEEKSRYWRSKNFYRFIEFSTSSQLVMGHTLTDQIETFFFNILRGSSLSKSSSLKYQKKYYIGEKNDFLIAEKEVNHFFKIKKKFIKKPFKRVLFLIKKDSSRISVIDTNNTKILSYFYKKKFLLINKKAFIVEIGRPLITQTRFDTRQLCLNWELPMFIDESNEQNQYSRNRIRNQILPSLRTFFNPKLDQKISNSINILTNEEKTKNIAMLKLLRILITENKNCYFFHLSVFSSLPLSFQREICLYFFEEKLNITFNFLTINKFIFFTKNLSYLAEKKNKLSSTKQNSVYLFFPKIGTLLLSKNVLIFIK